ncbi:hypothetical protein RN001_015973 [Aquatica leii]|uniref:Craniofacial development protein 2 n=1 Tax=Aquatica leii TaxID=1421715 RepID=A0AAN7PMN5_9COLE|nr:hypothetical protein RN001_015973 [Aquatica leii]
MKIILGDLNAKIGKEETLRPHIGKHSLHDQSNDNGLRIADFAAANNLCVKSTMFEHKDIHKQTWVSNDGRTRNQIDHIIIDKKFEQERNDKHKVDTSKFWTNTKRKKKKKISSKNSKWK